MATDVHQQSAIRRSELVWPVTLHDLFSLHREAHFQIDSIYYIAQKLLDISFTV